MTNNTIENQIFAKKIKNHFFKSNHNSITIKMILRKKEKSLNKKRCKLRKIVITDY
ncbi:MAG: hypothetical protein OHK0038_07780 [Flammeovirgaceae bacterium]